MADEFGRCAVCGDPADHGGRPHTAVRSVRGMHPRLTQIDEAVVMEGYLRGSAYCGLPLNLPHRWHHYDARCEPDGQVSHVYCPGVPVLVSIEQVEAFLEA